MLAKRLMDILNMLEQEEMVSVSDFAKRCGVTEKTIRLDLDKLVKMNLVTRVHGGAILTKGSSEIYPVPPRKQKHHMEKRQIARRALDLIEDGDTIFLDAGTTVLELARILDKNVIVVTNDPLIAAELIEHKSVTLYCTGGLLQRGNNSYVFIGPDAVQFISRYRTAKCFLACSALSLTFGLMVFSGIEAEIKKEIVRATDQVICMADSSKFNKTAFSSYLPLKDMDVCITDYGADPQALKVLEQNGVRVEIANAQ